MFRHWLPAGSFNKEWQKKCIKWLVELPWWIQNLYFKPSPFHLGFKNVEKVFDLNSFISQKYHASILYTCFECQITIDQQARSTSGLNLPFCFAARPLHAELSHKAASSFHQVSVGASTSRLELHCRNGFDVATMLLTNWQHSKLWSKYFYWSRKPSTTHRYIAE